MDGRGHVECARGREGEEDSGGAQMKSIEQMKSIGSCIAPAGISHAIYLNV